MSTADNNREHVASRLRAAREAAGLTQGQTAKLLKMHRPTISEIEAGRRKVSTDELVSFAQLYGVSVEWIASASETLAPSESRILLAARHLSKMKDKDLEKLLAVLQMLRKPGDET